MITLHGTDSSSKELTLSSNGFKSGKIELPICSEGHNDLHMFNWQTYCKMIVNMLAQF